MSYEIMLTSLQLTGMVTTCEKCLIQLRDLFAAKFLEILLRTNLKLFHRQIENLVRRVDVK
jgi:hypothetical protein